MTFEFSFSHGADIGDAVVESADDPNISNDFIYQPARQVGAGRSKQPMNGRVECEHLASGKRFQKRAPTLMARRISATLTPACDWPLMPCRKVWLCWIPRIAMSCGTVAMRSSLRTRAQKSWLERGLK